MKKCPRWHQSGDSVNGKWKQDLLRYLGAEFNLRYLIETGTCEGSTPQAVADNFKEVHTMELSPYYYNEALWRLGGYPNVHLYRGDSRTLLPEILNNIPNVPVLFWLDAHSSGGMTADEGDPLAEEIKIITEMRPDSLVVIDDMLDAELRHVVDAGVSLDGWIREYRTGEVIMHRGGYVIPPFEEWRD